MDIVLKKNRKKVSIIVPIYNSEKTIDRCVASLTGQNYDDVEIILVDDGSTDGTLGLCEQWKKKDKRVKVYHKENEGIGRTRSFGVSKATGDLVSFVDADDEVDASIYVRLCEEMDCRDVDVVGCCDVNIDEATGNSQEITYYRTSGLIEKERLICDVLYRERSSWGAIYNKLFRKEVLEKYSFPDSSSMEDYDVVLKVFYDTPVFFLREPLYIHHVDLHSVTHKAFNSSMLEGLDVVEDIRTYFRERNANKKILVGVEYLGLSMRRFMINAMMRKPRKNDLKQAKTIIKYVNKKRMFFSFPRQWFRANRMILRMNLLYFRLKFTGR